MRYGLLLLLLAWPARAQDGPSLMAAIQAQRWADADTIAAGLIDPMAAKLARYYRLLTPGAAGATEIAAFLTANPDWPAQGTLSRRLGEALALEPDDHTAATICAQRPPDTSAALLRCATAARPPTDPAITAREAWVRGVDGPAEVPFVRQWGRVLTGADQWRRFDRLAWTDPGTPGSPAARQAVRLDRPDRAQAEARLALRRDDPVAPALARIVHPDPATLFELARWYRRAGMDRDAAQVWVSQAAVLNHTPPERRAALWDERNRLGRRLLGLGEGPLALQVLEDPGLAGEPALDQLFLTGWLNLRLGRAQAALERFDRLQQASASVLTQSRAQYWRGRALTALQQDPAPAYRAAAQWPVSYYGQLAAEALGREGEAPLATLAQAADPPWSITDAQAFIVHDLAHASILLTAWNQPRRSRNFLLRLDELTPSPGRRAMLATLANGLGLPDLAVAVARRAGRDGTMLPQSGWPMPYAPPAGVEAAIVLALMRQESSFDEQIVSPAGARGLMQLMPATATAVARKLGEPLDLAALTIEPGTNMRLGTAYLRSLMDQFGAWPLALAAYNAGPRRVQDWITANGDPRSGSGDSIDMIDWIELIPFSETRNYVQRVMENVTVYRARLPAQTAANP